VAGRGGARRLVAVLAVSLATVASYAGTSSLAGTKAPEARTGVALRVGPDALRPSGTPSGTTAVPQAAATVVTVDTKRYSGFENSIYAATSQHVFVAYKRFIHQPAGTNGEVRRARLCVARSLDGGATWTVSVVDPEAGDVGDTIDDSVAIGGSGKTVYIAYLAQASEAYEDMKLKIAKSEDGGKTWTTRRIASGGVGEFTSIDVASPDQVLVATNWTKIFDSALRLYSTEDGGDTWTRSKVDGFGWYSGVDSAADGTTWLTYYHPGDTDQYAATGPGPTGPWTTEVVAGSSLDGLYTGIGASIAVTPSGAAFLGYDNGVGTSVLSRPIGALTWSAPSDLGPSGWDTGTEVRRDPETGQLAVFVAYWFVRSDPLRAKVRIGSSFDGGATWSVTVVPEPKFVAPYLDISMRRPDVRFVSYQTENQTTHATVLKVARITG
jgi:hypothetical protein